MQRWGILSDVVAIGVTGKCDLFDGMRIWRVAVIETIMKRICKPVVNRAILAMAHLLNVRGERLFMWWFGDPVYRPVRTLARSPQR